MSVYTHGTPPDVQMSGMLQCCNHFTCCTVVMGRLWLVLAVVVGAVGTADEHCDENGYCDQPPPERSVYGGRESEVCDCVRVCVGWSATLFPLNSACLDRLPFDQRSVACFSRAVCSVSRHYVTEMLTCGRVHDSICCDVWVRAQQSCMYNQRMSCVIFFVCGTSL